MPTPHHPLLHAGAPLDKRFIRPSLVCPLARTLPCSTFFRCCLCFPCFVPRQALFVTAVILEVWTYICERQKRAGEPTDAELSEADDANDEEEDKVAG